MKRLLPIAIFLGLFILLARSLFVPQMDLPSPLIGKQIPSFSLNELGKSSTVTHQDLLGDIALINIWATWCVGCEIEHDFLVELSLDQDLDIPIIGINWKDRDDLATRWLIQKGNPYSKILSDPIGNTAIDFGVYGAPETFLIDASGVIRYRYTGALNENVWENEFIPRIKALNHEKNHA